MSRATRGVLYRWDGTKLVARGRPSITFATQPTGPGITRVQDLPQLATLSATINQAPKVSLEPLTYAFNDFPVAAGPTGVYPQACYALLGSSSSKLNPYLNGSQDDSTLIKINPDTSTKLDPATGTNQIYLMRFYNPAAGYQLSGLTIEGTHQTRANGTSTDLSTTDMYYGGVFLVGPNPYAPTISDLKILGVPGYPVGGFGNVNGDYPPGETFMLNAYRVNNGVVTGVELDGRRRDGTRVSSSQLGLNNADGWTFRDSWFHHPRVGFPAALWQSGGLLTFERVAFTDCPKVAIHFERMYGSAVIRDCVFARVNANNGGAGPHIYVANDGYPAPAGGQPAGTNSCRIDIYDPIIDGAPASPTNRLWISVPGTYTQAGQTNTNTQLKADIHLWLSGAERPDCLRFT